MSQKKDRTSTDDCTMSWASMWSYFNSSYCSDDQRSFTIKHMNLYDILDGAMPDIQFEIMEFAPKVILKSGKIRSIIDPRVLQKLGWGMQQTKSIDGGAETTDDILTKIRVRAEEIHNIRLASRR
jgi:hypothetical protein